MSGELWSDSALGMAARIRSGEVSSREVIEAHLSRIEEVNPHLNAVVRVLWDEARAGADTADEARRNGAPMGPLHGVPFTVKENIDLAGTATTNGVRTLADAIAPIDAPVVERMRAAGAIPMGLGNDLGGSLRNPAHCCGISSIKPTTGVVPSATCIPPVDKAISFQIMAVEGVLGRHIAVLPEPAGGDTDAGIAAATRRVADVLSDMGHAVTDTGPASYARSVELWALLLSGDLRTLRPLLDAMMGAGGKAFLDLTDAAIPDIDVTTWSTVHTERFAIAREWAEFLADFDALVTPAWANPAFPHGADIADAAGAAATHETIRPVLPPNLLGLPVAVTPAGLSAGMPVGVQVIGDRFHDLSCLSIAELIERSVGVLTPIEPITA